MSSVEKNIGVPVENPELIIGLVGPIGVELEPVQESIITELNSLGYKTEFIKLTDLMRNYEIPKVEICNESFLKYYKSLIEYADRFRNECNNHSALAALAVNEIRERRILSHLDGIEKSTKTVEELSKLADKPVLGTAYLIRQFKLPQEIDLMRKVYGRKFLQISVYLSNEERKANLIKSIQNFNTKTIKKTEAETSAIGLMEIDSNEESEEYGQRITNVFHLGDVFVRGASKPKVGTTIKRFFRAFFGNNSISPTKMEYGMYAAAGAALRSIDLSRQVGAAIFSDAGEVQTLGCNEVPKAFGGTYWEDDESSIHRDFEEGLDANHARKTEILHDFLIRLDKLNLLEYGDDLFAKDLNDLVEKLNSDKSIKESQLMDIIEFGRMVHAEMNAITDSARLGKSICSSTLYCTTFPCHMCAKHIVSSGLRRVVFLEPYPKSYAEDLHSDSITFNPSEAEKKVFFEPFIGISPRRYRDIFEKKKRKGSDGKTKDWYLGETTSKPLPMLEDTSAAYIENEVPLIYLNKIQDLKLKP